MQGPSTTFGQTNGHLNGNGHVPGSPTVANGSLSRVDHIVAALQQQIGAGALRVGERLPSERSLCATFGVGRTTVREALKALLVQGYVARAPKGVTVADPDSAAGQDHELTALAARASIRDLYDVRKLLEVRVARWAALRATEADVEALRRAVSAESRPTGADEPRHSHAGLHDGLVRTARNPVLQQVYDSNRNLFFRLPFLWRLLDASEVHSTRTRRHELAHAWHVRIVEAVAERDPDEAEGAMYQHLDAMEKDLLAHLLVRPNSP